MDGIEYNIKMMLVNFDFCALLLSGLDPFYITYYILCHAIRHYLDHNR